MRVPASPPDLATLLEDARKRDRLPVIFGASTVAEHGSPQRYLHWEELRRRTPPGELSHDEWWLLTALGRARLRRPIPLRDCHETPFVFTTVDPISELLHLIDRGAGGRIGMPEPITNPDTKDQYYVSSLIAEATTSSQLEGATTTRRVAKEMLRSGRPPQDRSERMILNNYLTMRRIGELQSTALTPDVVLELHRLVTADTLDDPSAAGRFRRADERVVVTDSYNEVLHAPPPASELAGRMEAMCAFANGRATGGFVHPALRAIILHFWLAYDHPFVDGNGRTARALFYWSMLNQGFWLFEFVSISSIIHAGPAKYGRAFLYTETDANDLTYFILYHLEVIRRAIDAMHAYIDRKAAQVRSAEARIRETPDLNHRQRALLGHGLRHPGFRYSILSHQNSHDVAYATARADLLGLTEHGLLTKLKIGRRFYFRAEPDLQERLQALG